MKIGNFGSWLLAGGIAALLLAASDGFYTLQYGSSDGSVQPAHSSILNLKCLTQYYSQEIATQAYAVEHGGGVSPSAVADSISAHNSSGSAHSDIRSLISAKLSDAPSDGTAYGRKNGAWFGLSGSGTGDVSGPASSTDSHVALFDGTTGKSIKDGGALGGAAALSVGTTSGTVAAGNDTRIVGAVQSSRTVNGHALSADVTVSASDVGALPVLTGMSQGAIYYYNGSAWTYLSAGTSGYYLQTQGAGANPVWAAASSSGSGYGAQTAPSALTSADLGKPIIAQSGGTGGGFSNATIDAVSSSLLAAYKFDSLLLDSSGNGHALSNTGSVTQGAGKSGYGASFSGSTSQRLSASVSSQTGGYYAFSAWINPASTSEQMTIMGYGPSGSDACIRLDAGGYPRVFVWGSDNNSAYVSTSSVSSGTFSHIVGIVDESSWTVYLYVNGALSGSTTLSCGSSVAKAALRIGLRADDTSAFNGVIDEAYFWRGTSSLFADASARLAFAQALYNSGSGRFYTAGLIYDKAPVSWQRMIDNGVCDLRLTLSSTDDAPSSDITAATTLYALPAKSQQKGNRIALYDATLGQWLGYTVGSSGLSVAIPSTTATNYDVFACNTATGDSRFDSPSLALELVAWTDATTRATALYNLDGVYVKTGDYSRRYLGTIRTTGTSGQCEDSATKRFVWNAQNRDAAQLKKLENTANWTYNSTTYQYFHGDSANKVEFVIGLAQMVDISCSGMTSYINPASGQIAIGLDGIASGNVAADSGMFGSTSSTYYGAMCRMNRKLAAGYHYAAAIERTNASSSANFYGTGGAGFDAGVTGLLGTIQK